MTIFAEFDNSFEFIIHVYIYTVYGDVIGFSAKAGFGTV